MGRVEVSVQAGRDRDEIADHIAFDNPSAARKWLAELNQLLELIASQPLMGGKFFNRQGREFRLFPMGNYVLYYRVRRDGIFLARVVHGARDQSRIV